MFKDFPLTSSLGNLYRSVTRLIGMGYYGEGNTMGLAPYGRVEKRFELIQLNKGNFKRISKIDKKFPPKLIKTREKIAYEIHKMYNAGEKYEKIISKLNIIPSHISNVVTGEKFKELFF